MRTLRYDEEHLVEQLDRLSPHLRAAFAAACAERLVPAYAGASARAGRGAPTLLTGVLARLWADLASERMTESELRESINTCMTLIPDEEDGAYATEQLLAQDAPSAVAYALSCRQSGASQDAAWAAHCVDEVIHRFVVNRDTPPDGNVRTQTHAEVQAELEHVLADPLVQTELARQKRDLDELLQAGQGDDAARIARVRDRAKAEASSVFADA
jgi:uncharacterized protein YjaG (DUF416 family)